jgi:hypothetical protein
MLLSTDCIYMANIPIIRCVIWTKISYEVFILKVVRRKGCCAV